MPFDSMGRSLILIGIVLVVIGILVSLSGRVPWLGRLPGDLSWQRDNVSIYIPIATSIVISLVLTLLLNILSGLFGRR